MISGIIFFVLPVVISIGIIRKYQERKWGRFTSNESLTGKVFIVTGANCGIGKATTCGLVRRNAKVIMACRDISSAKKAISDIRRETSSGEMIPLYLDLQSIDSIRTFANIVLHDFPKIHVLINNAGISMPLQEKLKTDDGFELHFQVNYLGHFILTELLSDRLQESSPSRIVVVSSSLHEHGEIDCDNLNGEKGFKIVGHRNPAYCNTKLMNAYFVFELRKRFENRGVTVSAVCPGFCKTGLMRYAHIKWYHWPILCVVALFYMRTAKQGSETVLYCSIAKEVEKSDHWLYRNCDKYYSSHVFKPEVSAKLWQVTQQLIAKTKKF